MKCRHCNKAKANRARRLCWSCYYRPGVRDLYPPTVHKCFREGYGNGATGRELPEPTDAPVGSDAKVRVLAERARRGLCLWHPDDAREVVDPESKVEGSKAGGRPPMPTALAVAGVVEGGRGPRVCRYHGPR